MEDILLFSTTKIDEQWERTAIKKAQKNPKDFEPLYNKYHKKIFLFVLHKVNDKALAADITSQVFLKALLKINNYVYRGLPFSSWLFRVAINEINIFFKKNKELPCVVLDKEIVEILQEQLSLTTTEKSDKMEQLPTAIQSLKEMEVQIIDLRFYEGLAFKEIGEILDITENNAKVKLYRVLNKLRKLLDKQLRNSKA